MRAAVYQDIRIITVKEVPEPELGPYDVMVRPKFCGICGTDLGAYQHGTYGMKVILGHEFSGEIVELGEQVSEWKVGDRVVPNSVIPCNRCSFCRQGRHNLCNNLQMPGITINGGFADLVALPRTAIYKIPETVNYDVAALVEPLTTVLHGFKRLRSTVLGTNILVLGTGAIGLFSTQIARLNGANLVGATEINKTRRELARSLGADFVINPAKENVSLQIEQFTDGKGIDTVIECTGADEAISESFSIVNKGGNILVLGLCEVPVEADFLMGVLNELKILFAYCGYPEFEAALQLIAAKRVQVKPMISHVIKLEDIVEQGFEAILRPDSITVKVLVDLEK